jgi:hypothetical protein
MAIGLTLLLSPSVKAEVQTIGTFTQNIRVNLLQTCDNCTSVNITSIIYPDGSINNTILQMTKTGTFYNYSHANTSQIGHYIYNTVGNLNGANVTQPVDFYITQGGQPLTTGQSIIYLIGFIVCIFMFVFFFILSIMIPYDNDKDNDGNLINISKIKYVKLFMMAITYLFLLLLVAMTKGLMDNYLYLTGFSNILNFIYWIMLNAIYPFIVLMFVFLVITLVKDGKLRKQLERGGFFR